MQKHLIRESEFQSSLSIRHIRKTVHSSTHHTIPHTHGIQSFSQRPFAVRPPSRLHSNRYPKPQTARKERSLCVWRNRISDFFTALFFFLLFICFFPAVFLWFSLLSLRSFVSRPFSSRFSLSLSRFHPFSHDHAIFSALSLAVCLFRWSLVIHNVCLSSSPSFSLLHEISSLIHMTTNPESRGITRFLAEHHSHVFSNSHCPALDAPALLLLCRATGMRVR